MQHIGLRVGGKIKDRKEHHREGEFVLLCCPANLFLFFLLTLNSMTSLPPF
jgi:hypothetical protein